MIILLSCFFGTLKTVLKKYYQRYQSKLQKQSNIWYPNEYLWNLNNYELLNVMKEGFRLTKICYDCYKRNQNNLYPIWRFYIGS